MFVRQLRLHNYKSFYGSDPFAFTFGPRANYIVGNNNCGKTSIFSALEVLGDTKCAKSAHIAPFGKVVTTGYVEATFVSTSRGDFPASIQTYCQSCSDGAVIQIRRELHYDGDCTSPDSAMIYDSGTDSFSEKIPDKTIKELLQPIIIEALTDASDIADFGSTKLLGKIIASQTKTFENTKEWLNLLEAYDAAFSGSSGIKKLLEDIENSINAALASQYESKLEARITFDQPNPNNLIKNGGVRVDDGFADSPIETKGTGLQRAVAFAVIQTYAETLGGKPGDKLDLCIDEPETWMHPLAQKHLSNALSNIAEKQQLWISTHSPYMLMSYDASAGDTLTIIHNQSSSPRITSGASLGILQRQHPSIAEISYKAFELATPEYHSELIGYLQNKLNKPYLVDLDKYLNKSVDKNGNQRFTTRRRYKKTSKVEEIVSESLPVYIRNCIDHPEVKPDIPSSDRASGITNEFDDFELAESISGLEQLISDENL